jgi:hypothetical protein
MLLKDTAAFILNPEKKFTQKGSFPNVKKRNIRWVHSKFSQAGNTHQAVCKTFTKVQTFVAARCIGLIV